MMKLLAAGWLGTVSDKQQLPAFPAEIRVAAGVSTWQFETGWP